MEKRTVYDVVFLYWSLSTRVSASSGSLQYYLCSNSIWRFSNNISCGTLNDVTFDELCPDAFKEKYNMDIWNDILFIL